MVATEDFHSKYYTEWKTSIVSDLSSTTKFQTATVTKIIDGDTIEIMYNGDNKQVRLIGIDTPEIDEPTAYDKARHDANEWNITLQKVFEMGSEAKKYVEGIIKKGDKVKLEFDENTKEIFKNLKSTAYAYT